jgi:hypothetical protein
MECGGSATALSPPKRARLLNFRSTTTFNTEALLGGLPFAPFAKGGPLRQRHPTVRATIPNSSPIPRNHISTRRGFALSAVGAPCLSPARQGWVRNTNHDKPRRGEISRPPVSPKNALKSAPMHSSASPCLLNLIILFLLSPLALRAQEPLHTTACDLRQHPADFNHKLVEVTAYVSHGFEEFTLFDPDCADPNTPNIWLTYGGRKLSGTTYCCGEATNGTRPRPLEVEGFQIPLTIDENFKKFDTLVHAERATVVQATVIGRFFAGEAGKPESLPGYGHLGCCTLLAIQQITSVEPDGSSGLDLSDHDFVMDPPPRGCSTSKISKDLAGHGSRDDQQTADIQQDEIRFNHPELVAKSELMQAENLEENAVKNLRESRRTQGRITYQLRIQNQDGTSTTYTIVVHKSYLQTFSAINPHRIAWTVMALYKTTCTKLTP